MARLGKREREAKRALIKANLRGPREVSARQVVRSKDGTLHVREQLTSTVDTVRILARTHTGFRNPQNARGSDDGSRGGVARFSEQPRKVDIIKGPGQTVIVPDTIRRKAARDALAKRIREDK